MFPSENSLLNSRSPEIKKLVKVMDEKGKANLNSEDLRLYIDSCCSEIMRIKEIKPDLHRQWVEHLHIFKVILLWKLFFLDSYNLWRYVFVRLSDTNSCHLMWRNWGRYSLRPCVNVWWAQDSFSSNPDLSHSMTEILNMRWNSSNSGPFSSLTPLYRSGSQNSGNR